jgi:hypothetical protein
MSLDPQQSSSGASVMRNFLAVEFNHSSIRKNPQSQRVQRAVNLQMDFSNPISLMYKPRGANAGPRCSIDGSLDVLWIQR